MEQCFDCGGTVDTCMGALMHADNCKTYMAMHRVDNSDLREALEMAQEVRDLLLERIQGSPARSAAHNARIRADSLIQLLSSIVPAIKDAPHD